MTYLTEEQNVADLINQIEDQDQAAFAALKANRIEAAFSGRILVIYEPKGLIESGDHREPAILTAISFSDFASDGEIGADVVVNDLKHRESITVGHVPTRLFDYDIFLHIPPVYRLRWDARENDSGVKVRSLVFPVSIFTKNRSSHYSAGVQYAETPNRFRELFPSVKLSLKFD